MLPTAQQVGSYSSLSEHEEDSLPFSQMVLKFAEKVQLNTACVRGGGGGLDGVCYCTSYPQATQLVKDTATQDRSEVEGILNTILPCSAVLHITFPLTRCSEQLLHYPSTGP